MQSATQTVLRHQILEPQGLAIYFFGTTVIFCAACVTFAKEITSTSSPLISTNFNSGPEVGTIIEHAIEYDFQSCETRLVGVF